jgi:hypothetical protein
MQIYKFMHKKSPQRGLLVAGISFLGGYNYFTTILAERV